jgi:hypothetical protein
MENSNQTFIAAFGSDFLPQAAKYDYAPLRLVASSFEDVQATRLSIQNRLLQIAAQLANVDTLAGDEEGEKKAAAARDELVADFKSVTDAVIAKRTDTANKAANAALRKSIAAALSVAGITDRAVIADAVAAGTESAKATAEPKSLSTITNAQIFAAIDTAEMPHGLLRKCGREQSVVVMLCRQLQEIEAAEARMLKSLERALEDAPIYQKFLANVKGIGPSMAGSLLSYIDIHKAQYPSSLWKYAGLDVGNDGRGRSRRAEHLVDVTYQDKDGKEQTRKGITFNPHLKTTLFLCATSFLKVGIERSPYARVYYETKHRLESHPVYGVHNDGKEVEGKGRIQPGRRHMMAMRAAQKRFLVDLYREWRALEGLPVAPEYSEAKLGLIHGSAEKYAA